MGGTFFLDQLPGWDRLGQTSGSSAFFRSESLPATAFDGTRAALLSSSTSLQDRGLKASCRLEIGA